jgi:hypothetical protein
MIEQKNKVEAAPIPLSILRYYHIEAYNKVKSLRTKLRRRARKWFPPSSSTLLAILTT